MPSPSPRKRFSLKETTPADRNLADPATVESWIDARTEPSIRAVGWTPELDLHYDYAAWAKAEEHPAEVVLCPELFAEALDHHHVQRQRRLVGRDDRETYEPCRALKLIPAIRAVAA